MTDPYSGWRWQLKTWQRRYWELRQRWWAWWGLPDDMTPVRARTIILGPKAHVIYLDYYRRKKDRR